MTMQNILGNFDLTFSVDCAEFVKQKYREARVILEYGSGGSTLIAGYYQKTIITVESDRDWLNALVAHAKDVKLDSTITPLWVDIGETENWGYPDNELHWRNWYNYPTQPWVNCHEQGVYPDLVLIDGRFRVASFFSSCIHTKKPLTILFDDFIDRPHYHRVKQIVKPHEIIDNRMAVFHVQPGLISADFLLSNLHFFYDVE